MLDILPALIIPKSDDVRLAGNDVCHVAVLITKNCDIDAGSFPYLCESRVFVIARLLAFDALDTFVPTERNNKVRVRRERACLAEALFLEKFAKR